MLPLAMFHPYNTWWQRESQQDEISTIFDGKYNSLQNNFHPLSSLASLAPRYYIVMASNPNKKYESPASTCTTEGSSASSTPSSPVNPNNTQQPANNAPKYGTLVPNRIFVGGISGNTTETELAQLFSAYGNVKATKVISDRAGVSKGYGFVTFETEEEAKRLMQESESIVLKERKLNIAPAIKKQPFNRSYEVSSPPAVPSNTIYYQNGMPYTFHNGMAYFAPTTPPHPTANTPMGGAGDPSAMYQTAYVSPAPAASPAAAAAAAAAAAYPLIYPCAQPVFMSQQYPFQTMPPPAQNSQYVYTTSSSPSNGASGGGAPPPGTPLTPMPPQHFYSPSPMNPPELFYNVTPVAAGQNYGPVMTSSPDGVLYDTLPTSVETSNNPSTDESSSNTSRSDLQRSGGNIKASQDPPNINGVVHPEKTNSGHGVGSSTNQPGSAPTSGRQNTDTPPVVSLLKLQQTGDEPDVEQPPRSASVPYAMTPPPAPPTSSSLPPFQTAGPGPNTAVMPLMYHPMVPVGNPTLGSPLYMNQHLNYPPFVNHIPPMYGDQFRPLMANGGMPPHVRNDKRGASVPTHSSKYHFVNNNNPLAPDNNEKNGTAFPSPYQKRSYTRNGPGNYYRECPRFNSQATRFTANGPNNNNTSRNPMAGRFPVGPTIMNKRRNSAGNHVSPVSRSPPPASYSPLSCHIPEMHHSVSSQYHPGVRHIYYQPCNSTNSNSPPTNVGSSGAGTGIGGAGNGPPAQRRYVGNGRKSSSIQCNRPGSNSTSGTGGKYSRGSVNGVQALNSAKVVAGMDKGGAGDASSLMPMTSSSTPCVTDNSDAAVQEACQEIQALVL